jgi:hypothetical protein
MLLLTSYEEAVAADVDVVLWKVVTYQLIGEYRKRIAVVGPPHFSPSYSEPSSPVAALGCASPMSSFFPLLIQVRG